MIRLIREVSTVKKRTAAVLLVLCVLFCGMASGTSKTENDTVEESFSSALSGPGSIDSFPASFSVVGYNIPTFSDGNFKYRMSDDGETAVLVSYHGTEADVVFPDTVNGLPVTGIDTAMCLCDPTLESIRIPGSVQTIGIRAFAQCTSLKTVVIDEGVIKLDKCCFGGCTELEEIRLPESLEIVDDCAFASCDRLQEITFGSGLTSIGNMAFLKCSMLSRVNIPGGDDVMIGQDAFGECADDFRIVY